MLPAGPKHVADLVISSQVFQHLPGSRERRDFLDGIERITRGEGRIGMTACNHRYEIRRAIARGSSREVRSKEGRHSDGKVSYHCFDDDELRALVEKRFEVGALYGLISQIPKISYKLEGSRFYIPFDRIVQRTPFSKTFGLLRMARFQKRHAQAGSVVSPS